ncbi:hypothetical protein [Clostridium chromiireducens]|uniref:hypothetical protein n=1 Tax=Clostridium chromiireducens TaxID=225345 RepID=UPI001FAB2EBA|nr:hypothetical protein [Clostridium chromiireducens]
MRKMAADELMRSGCKSKAFIGLGSKIDNATRNRRKDSKMRGIPSAAGISALLGITEPAMFGVNLKLK